MAHLVTQFQGQLLRDAANNWVRGHASVCGYAPPSPTSSSFSIYRLYESFRLVFCLPLRLFPGTGASNILLCDLLCLWFRPTDPLTSSFLIVSFSMTPHIHRSIIISLIGFSLLTMSLSHTAMMALPPLCIFLVSKP